MKKQRVSVLRVAVFPPAPPDRLFDYLSLPGSEALKPGSRVQVRLGRRRGIGVVVETAATPEVEEGRLRPIEAVIDERAVLPRDLLGLLQWTAHYYQCPLGHVLRQTVPRLIRRGDALCEGEIYIWEACGADNAGEQVSKRAFLQRQLLGLLIERGPLTEEELNDALPGWRRPMRSLADKGLAVTRVQAAPTPPPGVLPHRLTEEQAAVLERITDCNTFACHLIEGVTGSGKTEVYLRATETALKQGGQVLVLVPEIGLTSQTVSRFRERYGAGISVFHSGMSEQARLHSWSRARLGSAKVVIGTRSATFIPFKSPALIIVDEEHDLSYKQHDGLRYHARDLAIKRAQLLDVPIVLGSATPSFESLRNAGEGQYRHYHLRRRTGGASLPAFEILDLRGQSLTGGLSSRLLGEVRACVAREEQVLLFLNRRGYATQLLCHACGEIIMCSHCDVPLVYHLGANVMRCHHCGYSAPWPKRCAQCDGTEFKDTGMGTERIERELRAVFPQVDVTRVDADTVRRKGELDKRLEEVRAGGGRILIGTQMLSKGHHFPQVTLVGILNVDQRLFAPDFRALERLGQLVVQVSGRAGRGVLPGKVCLQTYHPDNPHLLHLVREGYAKFARHLLVERRQARLPPYHFLALLRASDEDADAALEFLKAARVELEPGADRHDVGLLGPSPMMLEKRGGRYRAQLLMTAADRTTLNRCLKETLPGVRGLKGFRRVMWHVDVDPMEIE